MKLFACAIKIKSAILHIPWKNIDQPRSCALLLFRAGEGAERERGGRIRRYMT
jgi:hypothetical protein